VELIREPLMLYIEGCSSASQALKFARGIGLKGKLYLAFVLNCYRVALLRHLVLIVKLVVPRKSGRLTDVAGSLMEYVSTTTIVSIPARAAHEVSMQAILFPLWNIHSTVSLGCHSAVELSLDKMVLGPSSNQ
jgi:hypothetical protein